MDREEIPGLNVKTDGDVTVITMKSGDPGWPDYGIGLRKAGDSERNDFDRAMDWAASAAANKMMGEWFWVVPDNSELKRSVRIDVIDDEKKVIASTPCDQKPCMPTMTIGKTEFTLKSGQRIVVCGERSACPQFFSPPDVKIEMKKQ